MKRIFKRLLIGLLLGAALPALGQTASTQTITMRFEGCADAKGKPVPAAANEQLTSAVKFAMVEGKPVIQFNPKVLPRLLPESRMFLYAHECARQYLAFPVDGERTATQARDADCWAAATLKNSGVFAEAKTITAVEEDLNLVPADWALLPGPKRELKLATCSSTPRTKGSLALPQGAGNDKWNRCVQACGARLYSCGRSASCQMTYDQCEAACSK